MGVDYSDVLTRDHRYVVLQYEKGGKTVSQKGAA